MPRLPPVEKSPQARLRATLWPGVGYSVVTFDQSHSSSSATSWARPVSVPWPISERAMRMTDGVVGPDHDPGIDLGRAVGGAHHGGAAEGKIEADRKAGAGSGGADDEGAAAEFDVLVHGVLLRRSRRRGSLRAPAGRCRSGRYW